MINFDFFIAKRCTTTFCPISKNHLYNINCQLTVQQNIMLLSQSEHFCSLARRLNIMRKQGHHRVKFSSMSTAKIFELNYTPLSTYLY